MWLSWGSLRAGGLDLIAVALMREGPFIVTDPGSRAGAWPQQIPPTPCRLRPRLRTPAPARAHECRSGSHEAELDYSFAAPLCHRSGKTSSKTVKWPLFRFHKGALRAIRGR